MIDLKKFLRNTTFTSILLVGISPAQFLFTPFEDESSYKGAWNLSQEIPNYIAAYQREFNKVNVLSSTAYLSLTEKNKIGFANIHEYHSYSLIAAEVGFRYIVTGKIIDFSISRFSAGESNLAGYEAYNCTVDISIQIFDLQENSSAYSGNLQASSSSKGLGLNLFGELSDEKKQYQALNNIKFGSDDFNKTIVGEAMFVFCEDLTSNIKSSNKELLYQKKGSNSKVELSDNSLNEIKLNVEFVKGQILTYNKETGEAFINLGSSNKIRLGDEFVIYTFADSLFDPLTDEFLGLGEKSISTLVIIELRGEKLSLAVVKNNRALVGKGMEVKKLVLNDSD